MIRIPLASLAASLLGVAVLAGCGGGSKSTSQNTSSSPATTTAATSATGTTSTSTTAGTLTYQQAVETCQHVIHVAATQLPEATGLEGTCGRVVKNGVTAAEVKKAILGLCESALKPAGGEVAAAAALKEHALAVCRNSTK